MAGLWVFNEFPVGAAERAKAVEHSFGLLSPDEAAIVAEVPQMLLIPPFLLWASGGLDLRVAVWLSRC